MLFFYNTSPKCVIIVFNLF